MRERERERERQSLKMNKDNFKLSQKNAGKSKKMQVKW